MKAITESKMQDVAQACTEAIIRSGATPVDGLLIVLNMLMYHSSVVMDTASHKSFVESMKESLRRNLFDAGSDASGMPPGRA